MKVCTCGAAAELIEFTGGQIQFQVSCSDKCGRETAIWGGFSAQEDALEAWENDKVTILYTVTYLDETILKSTENTFSSFDLKVAARFACFLLQNNIPLTSLTRSTPYDETTTLWGYSEPDHNHSYDWLSKVANVEMKGCSCGNVMQQDSGKCASILCKG